MANPATTVFDGLAKLSVTKSEDGKWQVTVEVDADSAKALKRALGALRNDLACAEQEDLARMAQDIA